ncbi:MCE family protein [Gordonia hydrophobica]|uniref:MCE family protein n=1 Tax=Gordonia hydrophobica TaxID=40516 RepID=A0ABZ2TX02_9ACTN|nr:MCE family protein [Gordonia hydrophobica]MBM7365917.1 phospholipid/cholesterol/gamma-HCH transport system substrate-binding protein [Gordonia hydrophobica]
MKVTLSTRARVAGLGAAMVSMLALTGCSGIQSVPLPGGVDVGDNPRTYKIQFDDILDLVPQSVVKQDGIPVGQVTKVEVPKDAWDAIVTVRVKNTVNLSDQASASVQQTNLLGEKFVALQESPEAKASTPRQPESQVIQSDRTRTVTDIEQLLGALSMLLNGGGINQLEPIITSLNEALGDRPNAVRSLLKQSEELIDNLNRQRDDIVRAVEGVSKLSSRANEQTDQIERILNELPEGVKVLEEQRPQFVDLLTKLDDLGDVGTSILGKAHDEIITDLKALRPILSELAKSAQDAATALPLMLTHPFPDDLLPAVHGDSTNLFMTLDLRLLNQLEALGVGQGTPKYSPPSVNAPKVDPRNPYVNGNGPRYGWPTISLLPPAANSRPGPNTPPSGGTYPMNKSSATAQKNTTQKNTTQKNTTQKNTTTSKKKSTSQYTMMPSRDENFLKGTLSMLGGDDQ